MNRGEIEAFVRRDWQAVQDSKSAYWAERFQRHGWRPAWAAADALWHDVRRTRSGYPSADDRDQDLIHHLTLCAHLDRVASAFTRR